MILVRIDELNYWTGSWREFSQGDTIPDEGLWIEIENIPTETMDIRERRCWKYDKETQIFILDEKKLSDYNNEKKNIALNLKIRKLKDEIASTDYQIIKSYELSLVGETPEYDITSLHKERQAIRDKINELEDELKNN